MRPARIREDLPLPEVPTTASNRVRRMARRISSLWPSRPKNKCSSFASKARRPGNGSTERSGGGVGAGPSFMPQGLRSCSRSAQPAEEWVERFGSEGVAAQQDACLVGLHLLLLGADRRGDVDRL